MRLTGAGISHFWGSSASNKKLLIMLFIILSASFTIALAADDFFSTFSDSHTVALWLFDETEYDYTTLCDAAKGSYDLRLMPEGHLLAGKFGNCLSLAGGRGYAISYAGFAGKIVNNHIRQPDGILSGLWGPTEGPEYLLNALAGNDWTCEFWLKLNKIRQDITIIDLGQGYNPGFSLKLTVSDNLEISCSYSGLKALCPSNIAALADKTWHHIALTRSDSTVSYFLDGKKQGMIQVTSISRGALPDIQRPRDREHEHRNFVSMTFDQRRENRFNIAIGHSRRGRNLMHGMVDELRFSNVARYFKDFTPPSSFAQKFGANGANPTAPAVHKSRSLLFSRKSSQSPLPFGLRKYVFIDDAIVDSSRGVHFQMNRPTSKTKLDFVPEKSAWRPSVVDMGDMVYLYIPEGYDSALGRTFLFTSSDGIHFTEHSESPVIQDLPLYGTFFEDTNRNIFIEEKFKLTAWVGNRGICLFLSPDGVHWRRNETLMLPLVSGGGAETYYDDQRGRYVTFIKRDASFRSASCPGGGRRGVMFETAEPLKTWPFIHLDPPYFEGWTLPAVTCEGPVIFGETASGQAYRTRAIKYPWAPDMYLAFVWRFPSEAGSDPPRHVDLGVSRDGHNWKFFQPTHGWYIPQENDLDPEQLSISGLIRRGNKIWQYTDHGGPHGGNAPRTYYRWIQRLDGFVSLDGPGVIVTKPIMFKGENVKLILNSTGSIKVALQNEDGTEIPGFEISNCERISDSVNHIVSWSGNSDLTGLSGRTFRLKFELSNSKLYAFEFNND